MIDAASGGRDSEEREGSQERLQGDGDGDGNGISGAEDAVAGGEGGAEDKDAKPQGGGLRMWRAARDRAAWKADVLHVRSCSLCVYHGEKSLAQHANVLRAGSFSCPIGQLASWFELGSEHYSEHLISTDFECRVSMRTHLPLPC